MICFFFFLPVFYNNCELLTPVFGSVCEQPESNKFALKCITCNTFLDYNMNIFLCNHQLVSLQMQNFPWSIIPTRKIVMQQVIQQLVTFCLHYANDCSLQGSSPFPCVWMIKMWCTSPVFLSKLCLWKWFSSFVIY